MLKEHHGPLIFMIFVFWMIHLNRLNWTYFIAVNYTDEPAVDRVYQNSLSMQFSWVDTDSGRPIQIQLAYTANTEPSMDFRKANTKPSMHFRTANTETF